MANKLRDKNGKFTNEDAILKDQILEVIKLYKTESEDARKPRDLRNDRNWAAYLSIQDWSHKKDDQSKEFSPRTSMGVESVTSFIKRALVGFGNYFSMDLVNENLMTSAQARDLLKFHLDDEKTDFIGAVEMGVKIALLSSVMTFKTRHVVENDEFILKIDMERPEKTLPDPSGRDLYFIHEIVLDLHTVVKRAKQGIYDKEEVDKIKTSFVEQDKVWREERQRNHKTPPPNFRKLVTIHEVWGTIVNKDGEIISEDIVATMANNRYLIRKPKSNPRFHGKWPFVRTAIIKVPGSVWHKALYDDAVRINLYINELQNLMLDGGLAAAHDIKVLKPDALKEPEQASGGVPPGTTLLVKDDVQSLKEVMTTVSTGQVPTDALNMHNLASRDFDMASMFNDIKAGLLPMRQVKATEIIEKEQSSSQQLDGFARTVEKAIEKTLRLAWAEIMQFRNNYLDLEHIIGGKAALALSVMSPKERYDMFAKKTSFKVNGISSLITRGRNFQKLMVVVDASFKNPILASAFAQEYSPKKIIEKMFEGVDLDPSSIRLDKGETGITEDQIQQLFGGQKTGAEAAQAGGRNPLSEDGRLPSGKVKETLQ